jgi:homocysteine S-methyltransferase
VTTTWIDLFGDGVVVIDGGLSTQLTRLGQDISGNLWTGRALLADPRAVTRAHADYIDAGADVIITSSYQLSRSGFVEAGLTEADADRALVASVVAARAAVAASDRTARVAGSVGPYGAILHDGSEYRGNYGLSKNQLVDFHRERLAVLLDAGPDLLAIETIPDVREAEALVEVLADVDVPAWMTFSATDGGRTCAGQSIEDAVEVATSVPAVVATGINCTDPRLVADLVARMSAVTDLPIVVYPNAGGAWDAQDGEWHGDAPVDASDAFPAPVLAAWRSAGAIGIGGCCGTDARTIRHVALELGRPGG